MKDPDSPMSAAEFVPATRSVAKLREAAETCRGCELYRRATQVVFSTGPARATLMLVGEQPGDEEDRTGVPFVGAAGRLLDVALAEADINRDAVYITNMVKHFKWTARGKRRLHAKPSAREVSACRPWLEAEIDLVDPQLIVCLGATAAQGLLGRQFRVTRERGQIIDSLTGPAMLATYHPSAILRAPDDERRQAMQTEMIDDLRVAAKWLRRKG